MAAGTGRGTRLASQLQSETARDVIINNYEYLVRHVDAIRIFPDLVSSGLVHQDFLQRLERKVTDNDKMMALLQQLTKSTEGTWFDIFVNALSKVPQYEIVADKLLEGMYIAYTRTRVRIASYVAN